ncbi:MAG TPA: DUF4133 domain-containing protein [Candidatus Didemnitutus sp.]|nr:DUF4133 domain-containing protein [Candidatus Didemnitutus sp.]
MPSSLLHEHDAQQGAQSKGEFLGMTGNSSWWLLGSAGLAVFMVIVLWGVFGFPLFVCLLAGLGLCTLSLLYVFLLKNDKPAHYDTDFFESVLIEAGAMELSFGPRARRPENPFSDKASDRSQTPSGAAVRSRRELAGPRTAAGGPASVTRIEPLLAEPDERPRRATDEAPSVPLPAFERLQEELQDAQDHLEAALTEPREDSYAA